MKMISKPFPIFCATVFAVIWILGPFLSIGFSLWILFFSDFWPAGLLYLAWFWLDFEIEKRGARPKKLITENEFFKGFASYFPVNLVKTCKLPTNRKYIFGCHPHDLLSIGVFTNFATNATGFDKLFPGIRPFVMTLSSQFYFPIRRDLVASFNVVDSTKKSLKYLLSKTSTACCIVIGGAEESLEPAYTLILKNRKGFCKYALEFGADLVPVYNFGENEVYEKYETREDSWIRYWQMKMIDLIGFSAPIYRGVPIFGLYFLSIVPKAKPITTVVGKAIRVTQCNNPSQEQIDQLHSKYCEKLIELFEKHKKLHKIPKNVHLTIK